MTYYVLFFIHLESRRVNLAGITRHPDQAWMQQIARNATGRAEHSWIGGGMYHDRDTAGAQPQFEFECGTLGTFDRSIKEEWLSKLILFGEASLRRALTDFIDHYHGERNHQGKGNVLLFPARRSRPTKAQEPSALS